MSTKHPLGHSDRDLFRSAVGEVRTLHNDRIAPSRPRHRSPRRESAEQPDLDMMPDGVLEDAPAAGERQYFCRDGVSSRNMRQLARGSLPIQADLDLHGMTVNQARTALSCFFTEATERGVRRLRIVHGKGFGSSGARPVLKAQVDRWLRLRPEVIGFCSAPRHDGGTGAVYVLLRSQSRR